ncbi:MAG: endonuclease [Clostridia bacterium]|nr:endonuclease [Clostridia bacterium]
MKNIIKRSLSITLAFVMCVSLLLGLTLPAQAANVNYVKDGKYIYNWGAREEIATFLSQNAVAFYEDNDTSYSELSALSGSNVESSVPSSMLYKELQNLMKSNHSYINSYSKIKELCQYTDCQNSGGKISSFYSGLAIGPTWDGAWNREHTWPDSKGDKASDGEDDIMMIRPTSTSENSSRGNKAYGESSGYYHPNYVKTVATGYDLRGDVARIMLYQYVRWNCTNTGSKYNPNGIFGTSGVIESKEIMLQWIEEDPVDTWELGRNDSVESITGTRNVFVDYPELAFVLFGEEVPSDYTTPSGEAKKGPSSSNNNNTSGTQNSTQNNTQNGNQINTQNSTQNNSQGNTQNNSSVTTTGCSHQKAYKVAAEEPRCDTNGFTEGRYCPDCKKYISGHALVEPIGHTYAGDCDTICDICEAVRDTDVEHVFGDDELCTVCGDTKADDKNLQVNDEIDNKTQNTDVDSDEKTTENSGFKWWIIVIIIGGVIVAGGAVVLVLYRDKIWPKNVE